MRTAAKARSPVELAELSSLFLAPVLKYEHRFVLPKVLIWGNTSLEGIVQVLLLEQV